MVHAYEATSVQSQTTPTLSFASDDGYKEQVTLIFPSPRMWIDSRVPSCH